MGWYERLLFGSKRLAHSQSREEDRVRTLTFRTQSVEKYSSSSFVFNGAKARLDSRVEISTLAERRIEAPTVSSAVAISVT